MLLHMSTPQSHESPEQGRVLPTNFDPRRLEEEMMNALVVEDSPQIAERLVELVNQTGEVFLSHTRLRGRVALRLAIGHLNTTEAHVRHAWDLLIRYSAQLRPRG